MGRGGDRRHPKGCECGHCPKVGAPKLQRSTDPKVAERVLAKQKAEALWNEIVETDAELMRGTKDTRRLRGDLMALEDRAYGEPMQFVDNNVAVFVLERIGARTKK